MGSRLIFKPETHEYFLEDGRELYSITRVLREAGLVDESHFNDEVRQRGTAVHAAIHYLNDGDLNWSTVDEAILPYVRGYEKFKQESGFVPVFNEQPFFSERYMIACHIDQAGALRGKDSIVEIKTGSMQPWTALQTAGQSLCLPGFRDRRFGLELPGDGTYRLQHFTHQSDEYAFLSCLALAHWKRNNGYLK